MNSFPVIAIMLAAQIGTVGCAIDASDADAKESASQSAEGDETLAVAEPAGPVSCLTIHDPSHVTVSVLNTGATRQCPIAVEVHRGSSVWPMECGIEVNSQDCVCYREGRPLLDDDVVVVMEGDESLLEVTGPFEVTERKGRGGCWDAETGESLGSGTVKETHLSVDLGRSTAGVGGAGGAGAN